MANQTMRYETILVFNSSLGEEAVSALNNKFQTLIKENATVEKVEDWGKRRLAYPIDDVMEGNYLLVQFECKPDFPAELNRVCEITEGVLRVLIVRNEFEQQAAQTAPAPAAPAAPAAAPAPVEAAPEPEEVPAQPDPVEEPAPAPEVPEAPEEAPAADTQE